jgi:hypothetical protein
MNINFSSPTGPARVKEEAAYPITPSHNVRDPSSRNKERVSPLPGNKRPRQDDYSISEFRVRNKIARSSSILTQRSNTMKAL